MGRRHSDTKRLSTRYSASLRRFSGPTLRPTLDVSCGTTTFEIVVVASHVANFLYLYTCILSNSMAFQNSSETSEISEPWETYIASFSLTNYNFVPTDQLLHQSQVWQSGSSQVQEYHPEHHPEHHPEPTIRGFQTTRTELRT